MHLVKSIRQVVARYPFFRWLSAHPVVIVVGAFAASRLYYWAIGIQFDDSTIGVFNQIWDRQWLQERLGETIFYTHGQPPLLNLLVGLVLKISPRHATLLFEMIFLGLGLLLSISMYNVIVWLRVPPALAALACVLFLVSPSTIIYENWLMYTYPVASLLMAAFWFLSRFIQQGAWWNGLLFASLLMMVALLRASFHLAWMIGMIVLTWKFSARVNWRPKAIMFLPCLLVFGVYLKNYIVFGSFSTSSWFGMNWYTPLSRYFPEASRQTLLASGQLNMTAGPWYAISTYGNYVRQPHFDAIPALAAEKKASGVPNFNHYAYLEISRKFIHDDLVMLRHCPGCYVKSVGMGIHIYLRSTSEYIILHYYSHHNMFVTAPIRWMFDNLLYGRGLSYLLFGTSMWGTDTYPTLFFGIPLVFLGSGWATIRLLLRGDVLAAPLLGMLLTCVFISSVYCSVDLSENNRFRYELDPLLVTLVTFTAWDYYGSLRRGAGR